MPPHGKEGRKWSIIYEHYTTRDDLSVKCNYCDKIYAANKFDISDSWKHMRSQHSLIADVDARLKKKKAMSWHIGRLIVLDCLPLKLAKSSALCDFGRSLLPSFDLPSYNSVTKAVESMHDATMTKVDLVLAESRFYALTCDGWTSASDRKYLRITVHTYYRDHLVPLALALVECPSQTADQMAVVVNDCLAAHGLERAHMKAIVTDESEDMIVLCNTLNVSRVGCMAHMLELLLKNMLKPPIGAKVTLDEEEEADSDEEEGDEVAANGAAPHARETPRCEDQQRFWSHHARPGAIPPEKVSLTQPVELASTWFTFNFTPPAAFCYPPTWIWEPVALCRKILNKIVGKQDYRKAVKRYMIECNIKGNLVVECETRWGTVFRLVQKFFDLIPALFRFASSTTCPSGMGSKIRSVIMQLPVLKALIFAWEPVQRFETTIQADRHSTAGMSYPFAYSMVQRLGNNFERIVPPLPTIVQKVTDDALLQYYPILRLIINRIEPRMKQAIVENMVRGTDATVYFASCTRHFFLERLHDENFFCQALRYATILTPEHRHLNFLPQAEKELWYGRLDEIFRQRSVVVDPAVGFVQFDIPPYADVGSALGQYIRAALPNPPPKAEDYWFRGEGAQFPVLVDLFREFCCVPATSAPSERFFSTTGLTVGTRRTRLGSSRLQQLSTAQWNAPILLDIDMGDPTLLPPNEH